MTSTAKPYWLWDVDLDEQEFESLLSGRTARGRLDREWAAARFLDYAPYSDIIGVLSTRDLVENWPRWRSLVRSASRRRGLDFLTSYLAQHPEKIRG